MQITINPTDDYILVKLDGEMTIYNATSIKEKLLRVVEEAKNVEINLFGVSDIDSAGVQLLLVAKREISNNNCQLRLTAHSRAVLELFELYDLTSYFGDPVLVSNPAAESSASGPHHEH